MPNFIDLTGRRFGRLTVTRFNRAEKGRMHWDCVCDCGNTKTFRGEKLRGGLRQSCGCLFLERVRAAATTHGMHGTREYTSWASMKNRCLKSTCPQYPMYGGAGIKVSPRWLSFEDFFADMGKRSPNTSLDRIDPYGNYEPGNCRWASPKVQSNNRRVFPGRKRSGWSEKRRADWREKRLLSGRMQ